DGFCDAGLCVGFCYDLCKEILIIMQVHGLTSFHNNTGRLNPDIVLCPDSKGIPEQVIEEAFIESYRLLCSDNQEVMNEFLSRIEKTLGDDANEKNYQKAKKEVKQYKEKRKKLLDKYVDDGIDKETYMSMDAE
ncbi:MAG: hypothetical protein KBG42_03505, partial [Lachnospiraceae bacterium]|nr:hypothetical protein [Lachnospiraceae bacterium]